MTVAVTGATGFVGARLVASLLADGQRVQALVPASADAAPLACRGVAVTAGDVRDPAAVARALAGAEVVYHLVGIVPGAARSAAEYRAVNVGGTANVVAAAVSAGVRHLVHCSTVAVHGSPRRPPIDEDAPFAPVNAYQWTKLAGERIVARAARAGALSAVIARPTTLYGPGDRRGVKLFRDVARGRVVIVGDGTPRCHMTYVDDAVAALRLCAARAPSAGERFIVGGDERPTVEELVRAIAAAMRADGGGPARLRVVRLPAAPFAAAAALYRMLAARFTPVPGVLDGLEFFLADRAYDTTRARRDLGFQPRVPLHEGVRRTVAAYREAGLI